MWFLAWTAPVLLAVPAAAAAPAAAEPAASSTTSAPRVWLHGAVGGGGGIGAAGSAPSAEGAGSVSGDTLSVLGGASGGLSVRLGPDGKRSAGIVLHVGEGYASNEGRTVGAIDADVRWPSADGPYAFLGFAHRHETTLDLVVAHPVGATLATLPGIEHRTGFEVGGGWDFPTPWAGIRFAERVRPITRLAITVLPGTAGPPAYVVGELGLALSVGPVVSAKP